MNYRKRGLQKLLNQIIAGDVGRIVLNHKDRLLRFGAELVFAICEIKNVEIVILNQGEDTSFEQDLAQDVLDSSLRDVKQDDSDDEVAPSRGGEQIDDILDGLVGAVVGDFESAVWAILRIRTTVEAAVGKWSAQPLVEEQK